MAWSNCYLCYCTLLGGEVRGDPSFSQWAGGTDVWVQKPLDQRVEPQNAISMTARVLPALSSQRYGIGLSLPR